MQKKTHLEFYQQAGGTVYLTSDSDDLNELFPKNVPDARPKAEPHVALQSGEILGLAIGLRGGAEDFEAVIPVGQNHLT